jgi:hypothetical protein
MDIVSITALITGISALVIGILSHIKRSKCWCFDLETRELKTTPPVSPANQAQQNPHPTTYGGL